MRFRSLEAIPEDRGSRIDRGCVGARRVIVAMQHTAKGKPKIVEKLTLPPTATRRVSLVVTDLAVIEPTTEGLVLRERAPGVTTEEIVAATAAKLLIVAEIPEMPIAAAAWDERLERTGT